MERRLLAICGIIVGSIGLILTIKHGFRLQSNCLMLIGSAAIMISNKR